MLTFGSQLCNPYFKFRLVISSEQGTFKVRDFDIFFNCGVRCAQASIISLCGYFFLSEYFLGSFRVKSFSNEKERS